MFLTLIATSLNSGAIYKDPFTPSSRLLYKTLLFKKYYNDDLPSWSKGADTIGFIITPILMFSIIVLLIVSASKNEKSSKSE